MTTVVEQTTSGMYHPDYDQIAGWVSRQIDLDESAAREASPGPWSVERVGESTEVAANARHVALHDPQRVLDGVAAKRDLLSRLDRMRRSGDIGAAAYAEAMTLSMAAEYRRRPGWREEWALD